MDLSVKIGSTVFKNPITVASGTFNFGEEIKRLYDPSVLGAIFLKGLTLKKREGNFIPRICETPSGFLNSIGLQNPGIKEFVNKIYPKIKKEINTLLIPNLSGFTVDEYVELVRIIEKYTDIKIVEINVSCPNIHKNGKVFASDKEILKNIITRIKESVSLDVIVKLSPNVSDIGEIARVVEQSGGDAISAINTLLAMEIDVNKRKPVLANVFGGLSGPAIRPVALRCVYQIYEVVKIPIIGIGGITSFEDVLKFFYAGAQIVSIGTANFYDPFLPVRIINYLKEKRIHLKEIVGIAH